MNNNKYISVGKILNFHGIKGETKVGFSHGQEDFLKSLKTAYVKRNGEYEQHDIVSVRFNKQFALIKFADINSINDVAEYKNCLIFVPEEYLREVLEDDEFLIDELVGLDVIDIETNEILGTVVGVSNNGASDLLSVRTNTQSVCLVPFVNDLVPDVKLKEKKVFINNIEGLLQ